MTDCAFSVEVIGEVIRGDQRIKVIDNEICSFILPPEYKAFIRAEEELLKSLSTVDIVVSTSLLWKWLVGGEIYGSTETSGRGSIDSQEE